MATFVFLVMRHWDADSVVTDASERRRREPVPLLLSGVSGGRPAVGLAGARAASRSMRLAR
ncbi:hypothetical protein GCM10009827_084150 [Dactylosporangium maewongense]|uniref:Uncharacterized protein n=1 Tax=Dactylosporangium maewongense TaxID=634393 RepID=A0ABP4MXJ9_9ACTN